MMNINKLLIIGLTVLSAKGYGQQLDTKKLEATVHQAIEKAYPASIRMWGYDTTAKQQMSAQFSGVVVSAQGDILTAAHTTIPGKTYLVMFPDGKQAVAVALGKIEMADDHTVPDVSMMKIVTPGTWPFAEMGYSSSLKVNEPCISIAYPESLNQPLPSVRFGRITHVLNERGFIQSTCIMEPGDSGGPLFDYLGRVIGLHSAINVPESINYEIPVDLYRKYRTALQAQQVYNALPANVDKLTEDPLAKEITAYKQLENLAASFKLTNTGCVVITSQVKGKEQKIYGSAFTAGKGSLIVSKSSQVGNNPVLQINNKNVTATVVRRDVNNDLVLLQAPETIKGAIKPIAAGNDTLTFAQLGKFLVTPRPDTVNAISVAGSSQFGLAKNSSTGFLGASIALKNGPLLLTFVRKASPAEASGLKTGDEVISINSKPITKAEQYGAELQQYWPGDTISMSLKRDGEVYTKQIVLTEKPAIPATHPAEMFDGGKSTRRDGFKTAFVHDAVLTPSQCGGPVYDAAGRFQGINIARYSRTSTVAIPAGVVYQFIAD